MDSDDEGDGNNQRRRGSIMAEKVLKVTYSYDGKIMPVKELQLNDSKLIQPRINIEDGGSRSARGINSSMTSRTISTR